MAERRTTETSERGAADLMMLGCEYGDRLRARESRDYNCLAFRHNEADDHSLCRHVLIVTITEECPNCKIIVETKGMCSAARYIKLPQIGERQAPLRTLQDVPPYQSISNLLGWQLSSRRVCCQPKTAGN